MEKLEELAKERWFIGGVLGFIIKKRFRFQSICVGLDFELIEENKKKKWFFVFGLMKKFRIIS